MKKKKHQRNEELQQVELQEEELPYSIYVPQFAVEMAQFPPQDVNAWKDLEERKLYLNSEVTPMVIDYIGYYILHYNEVDDMQNLAVEDRLPIRLFINTNGGDGASTLHICDLIKNSKTPVWGYAQANAWSAGGYMLIACDRRFCWKHTTYLLHSGSFELGGNIDAVKDTVGFVAEQEEDYKNFVLENTKITSELYDKNYRRQWFMKSQEMLELGIVDEIIGMGEKVNGKR